MRDTLTRTSDWVKFAEAKNAALLTFASAWLLALGNMALGANRPPAETLEAIAWAAPLVLLAATFSVFSFMPALSFFKKKPAAANLLFYDHIEARTGSELLDQIRLRYQIPEGSSFSPAYLEDLAEQLAANSRIASRKFRMFNYSAVAVLGSIFTFFIFAYGGAAAAALRSGLCGG